MDIWEYARTNGQDSKEAQWETGRALYILWNLQQLHRDKKLLWIREVSFYEEYAKAKSATYQLEKIAYIYGTYTIEGSKTVRDKRLLTNVKCEEPYA